jgi:uncharacterized membrane protein
VSPTGSCPQRLYHRLLGRDSPTLRRAVTVVAVGLAVTLALIAYTPWELALVSGWDAAAVTFLASVWHFIARADGPDTKRLATREDDTKSLGNLLLVAICVTSLFGVGSTLGLAGDQTGVHRKLLIAVAVSTVALSCTMLNTIYTLRYADLYYRAAAGGIAFDDTVPRHHQLARRPLSQLTLIR